MQFALSVLQFNQLCVCVSYGASWSGVYAYHHQTINVMG